MKKVVILIADEHHDLEVWYPLLRFKEAGWTVITAGIDSKKSYQGKFGYPITVDTHIDEIKSQDFDAIIIPGGWAPDYIRRSQLAIELVSEMFRSGKIVSAICHGGWVLASANILKGKSVTSVSAIKDDLINAGALWLDKEVVVDENLVTSRKPDDLPYFCKAILAMGEKIKH
ncbi:MAG: type 1 glutamine amidotransferase [Proteobacteria bacterium]|nr:type 1 glutamine amidotransferase [Pseudomonadota bacterium]